MNVNTVDNPLIQRICSICTLKYRIRISNLVILSNTNSRINVLSLLNLFGFQEDLSISMSTLRKFPTEVNTVVLFVESKEVTEGTSGNMLKISIFRGRSPISANIVMRLLEPETS